MIEVVAAVIEHEGKYLIARRAPGKHLAGYWEFPGGKIEEGETPEQSLQREIQEEFGLYAEIGVYLGDSIYDYGTKVVRLMAYQAIVHEEVVESTDHDRIEWSALELLGHYKLAPADVPLLSYLK